VIAFLFRWLLRLASLLVFLAVGAFALTYYFAARSLPDYDATYTVAGLDAPIEIVRDNANVPHIFGQSNNDVFFALGYAHAQDRMWQMTMLRRTVQGRLSELFGERTLPIDRFMRRLDLYNHAIRSVDAQDEETTLALRAYSDGVNAWFAEVNKGARGRGAPEMWLFNHAIAPWEPADSLAVMKLMAVQLSGHASYEVLRARVSLVTDEDRLNDILPDDPTQAVAELPEYASLMNGLGGFGFAAAQVSDPLSPIRPKNLAGASNAWAAGISRSATGSTLLANDPHMQLTAPTLWYLARLELERGGVIGGTIPGMPIVLVGRNVDLGWGLTSSYLDDQDLYIEEVNPDNPNQYRTPDGWADFETRDSIINIKDGIAETLKLRWTTNGPVLSPDQLQVGAVTPSGHVTSLAWTAFSDADTSMSAAISMMQASSVADAVDATRGIVAPSQNITLADRNNVAMVVAGANPNRSPEHQSQGRIPTFGYLAENRWDGFKPTDENPSFLNPDTGLIGNTNNKTIEQPFPDHISFRWGDTQRVQRWERLMQTREVHTRDSFVEAQLDAVSFTARSLLPLVGADLWFTGDAAPERTIERRRQEALQLLADWNGEMNEHLPEPLIYAAWMRELQVRLIRDDLGMLAQEFTHVDPVFIERVFRDTDGASAWCDVIQSAPVETCTDIARQSLEDALIWLDENYGSTVATIRWGDAHEATHDHPVLGTAPLLNWFVNIRQSTSGGDNTLQRGRTSGLDPYPFNNVHAAGYRGVYDFADPDSSVFISATGQSGHPLSRYYDNLGELWRRGEYIPMSLDPALARGAALGVTTLIPEE